MKKLNIALIGCGKIALSYEGDKKTQRFFNYITHAQTIKKHPNYHMLIAVDPLEKQRKLAKEYGFDFVVENIDALDQKQEIDVLVIATPPNLRFELIKNFPHVKAIICEKPLAMTLNEAVAIENFCMQNNIILHVNFWRRYDRSMINLAKGGLHQKIGHLQHGFALYGNGLMNNGIHMIDLIDMLVGPIDMIHKMDDEIKDNPLLDIRLQNHKHISMAPVDFNCYREIYLDLWGQIGRLIIAYEGLNIFYYPKTSNRALENHYEINMDNVEKYPSGAGDALYDLYQTVYDDLLSKDSKVQKKYSDILRLLEQNVSNRRKEWIGDQK
ncbi:MAG: Gfo/Idh/MocA family oxidoreductase [Pseudomonadota bacterium]